MKCFLPLLLLILAVSCAPKVHNTAPPKPDWLSAKPFPDGYYTGIGHSPKDGTNNYIQIAKKSALEDLVASIKVNVSSTSVLSLIDENKQFHDRFEQIIQTDAADEIEEFELVEAWEDEFNYWVYYRLSKARYKEIKEEQKRNAVLLATDFYKKARQADTDGQRVLAIGYYFQALRSMEKYLGDAIWVTVDGQQILITNEIYAAIQQALDNIALSVNPTEIVLNRRMNTNTEEVIASAAYKDLNQPAIDLPLKAAFEKGQGVVYPEYKTDDQGQAKMLLSKIGSRELEQTVVVKVDIKTLAAAGEDESVFSLVADALKTPSAQVVLKVQRPVVYLTAAEESFHRTNHYQQISNKLKNLLATAGFEFTPTREAADLWVDVTSDTEKGSVSGSIYITHLTAVVRVTAVKEQKEIYAMTLDRLKGYGLDYDRSSVDAYNRAVETLEKERMKELIDTILQ